ncbi:metal-dependent hydrolase [Chloroflexota bacterium]
MFVLAHVGITLGTATIVVGTLRGSHPVKIGALSWFTGLGKYIDIRLLMVGSLLPDIIDKPLGHYFLRDIFSNGRILSHTLLFLVLIATLSFYLYKRHSQLWPLTLSFGSMMHLILDQMWLNPKTLFWPFLGIPFARYDINDWLMGILKAVISEPVLYVPEIIGAVIIILFCSELIHRRGFLAFITTGKT